MLCSSRALRHVNNGIYYTDIYTVQLYRYSCTAVLQRASQHQQAAGRQAGFKDARGFSTVHGMAQKTDLRAVQLYEKNEPKIPQAQTLKSTRKQSVKSSMK